MLTLRLISLLGFFVMIGVAWLLSSHRWRVNRRIVVGGILLQFGLALLIMKTGPGYWAFRGIGTFFEVALDFVNSGSETVFGPNYADFFFAFNRRASCANAARYAAARSTLSPADLSVLASSSSSEALSSIG